MKKVRMARAQHAAPAKGGKLSTYALKSTKELHDLLRRPGLAEHNIVEIKRELRRRA